MAKKLLCQERRPARQISGRPRGAAHFVEGLEKVLGRTLMPKKADRKPKKK